METNDAIFRLYIHKLLRARMDFNDSQRKEAIIDYISVSSPGVSKELAEVVAEKARPLVPNLYAKWIGLFVDRLFETVNREQISLLCDGSEDNDAAIVLSYLMFLESERMEKQMEQDIKDAQFATGEDKQSAQALCAYVLDEIQRISRNEQQGKMEKANEYLRNKARDN